MRFGRGLNCSATVGYEVTDQDLSLASSPPNSLPKPGGIAAIARAFRDTVARSGKRLGSRSFHDIFPALETLRKLAAFLAQSYC
jgi:hypothetical protein